MRIETVFSGVTIACNDSKIVVSKLLHLHVEFTLPQLPSRHSLEEKRSSGEESEHGSG